MSLKQLFVIDTNIVVSAVLIKGSKARQALNKAQTTGIILVSTQILSELEEVLARPKFDKYIASLERKLFLASFIKTTQFIEIEEKVECCRGPKDDKFLELAVNGKANLIVSGD